MVVWLNRNLVAIVFSVCLLSNLRADETSVTIERDLVFAEVDGQELKLDLYLPSSKQKAPLVVWIHGGGWRGGSKNKAAIQEITKHGFALASISYRLTNKAIFPAQIHDCKGAVRWLRANADRFGYNADWIAVAGSSAGGHLALLMGTSGGVAELEGDIGGNLNESSAVQAVIDYFGPSDFVLLLVASSPTTEAQDETAVQSGISVEYRRDVGIENHPSVSMMATKSFLRACT